MTVAAPGEAAATGAFETVGRLADQLGLEERSMGMSDDLEVAVAAGSTMVRVGRALFGERGRLSWGPRRNLGGARGEAEGEVTVRERRRPAGDLPVWPSRHYAVL